MKAREIRDMGLDEMERKLVDLKQELFNLRFQHAGGQLESPAKLRQVRREVARMKTVIRETQLTDKEE